MKQNVFRAMTLAALFCAGFGAKAAPQNQDPIWRAQLYVKVCDVQDSSTDNSVYARLGNSNRTYLNYARNDFQRNSAFTYDLVLINLRNFHDLDYLKIAKTGDNGTCLRSIKLLINGQNVFERTLPNHWLDGSHRSYTVSLAELQAHPNWQNYRQPAAPTLMSQNELESRIESMVATQMHGDDVGIGKVEWAREGRESVSISRVDSNTAKVDLDLKVNIPAIPDAQVDLDFKIDVACVNGAVRMTVYNYRVSLEAKLYEYLGGLQAQMMKRFVEDAWSNTFDSIRTSINTGTCPNVSFSSGAGLVIQ